MGFCSEGFPGRGLWGRLWPFGCLGFRVFEGRLGFGDEGSQNRLCSVHRASGAGPGPIVEKSALKAKSRTKSSLLSLVAANGL